MVITLHRLLMWSSGFGFQIPARRGRAATRGMRPLDNPQMTTDKHISKHLPHPTFPTIFGFHAPFLLVKTFQPNRHDSSWLLIGRPRLRPQRPAFRTHHRRNRAKRAKWKQHLCSASHPAQIRAMAWLEQGKRFFF
jgi:hypothetical protein